MARHPEVDSEGGRPPRGRQDFIDALLALRRPHAPDDTKLLARIESKTAQHRTPFSANISRQHASILSALSPSAEPKLGRPRSLTPSREASQRKAFEVFEWDRDFEPVPEGMTTEEEEAEETLPWVGPGHPLLSDYVSMGRGAADDGPTPYMASGGEGDEDIEGADDTPVEETEEEGPTTPPEPEPEEIDLSDITLPSVEPKPPEEEEEEAEAPEPGPPPERVEEKEEVVVEGLLGHKPKEGGEFPGDLMEQLDEAAPESTAKLSLPREEEPPIVSYTPEPDLVDETEAEVGEVDTEEVREGAAPVRHWPSETGLELHIDGFEHIASRSDLCPRCGRRINARNRLLTCTDCGVVSCESCEMRTTSKVEAPYAYDWRFEFPLCIRCYEKAYSVQKLLAKAKAALGMGNLTYAFYHAQQALQADPTSTYATDARTIIDQVDRRRREVADQDEAWKKQRQKLSKTSIFHED